MKQRPPKKMSPAERVEQARRNSAAIQGSLWSSDRPHDLTSICVQIGKLWDKQAFTTPTKRRSEEIINKLHLLVDDANALIRDIKKEVQR